MTDANHKDKPSDFLRMEEMRAVIAAEDDKITQQLMQFASNNFASVVLDNTYKPVADFDMEFFIRVVQKFVGDHDGLRMFLDGKADDNPWYDDPPEPPA